MKHNRIKIAGPILLGFSVLLVCFAVSGCNIGGVEGYSNQWLYPDDVSTVYVEMFDSQSFRRGHEYTLTDAICKRIETETPYKIVSDRDEADTVLSGRLSIYSSVLARERYQGTPLETETLVAVSVSWKNLRTGELLINNEDVTSSATYSPQMSQPFEYSANLAVNKAAQKVVELMEISW